VITAKYEVRIASGDTGIHFQTQVFLKELPYGEFVFAASKFCSVRTRGLCKKDH